MWLITFCFYICFLNVIIICCNGLKIFENSLNATSYKKFYHRTAEFGPNPGQYNVSGQLEIMNPLIACGINKYINKTTQYSIVYNEIYKNKIVLIIRGNCTFSKKVSNAEILGAIGVIIGDYNSSSDEWIVMSKDPSKHNKDITIPSVFIPHNTYQWILKLLLSDKDTKYIAILDEDGEYIAPTSTFWLAAFGIVIIVIPTLWCFIVCMALLRQKIINYIQQSRRKQYLTQIPIILYKHKHNNGHDNEINLSVIPHDDNNNNTNQINETNNSFSNNFKNMSRLLLNSFRSKKELMNPHNDSCAICLEDFKLNEELRLLPCNHGYHMQCVDKWLHKQSELCPMCKQSIFIDSNK